MWEKTDVDAHRVFFKQFAPKPLLNKLYSHLEAIDSVSQLVGYAVVVLTIDPGYFSVKGRRTRKTDTNREGPHILRAETEKNQDRHMDGWSDFISMALHLGCSNTTKFASKAVESLTSRLCKVVRNEMSVSDLLEEILKELDSATFSDEDLLCFFGDFTLFIADQEIHCGLKTPHSYVCPLTSSSHRQIVYMQFVRKSITNIKHPFYSSEYTLAHRRSI